MDAETTLIEAARAGDEDAYRGLVEPHRGELYAHCYRMLASVDDAEDALQETLVRAWRGLPTFAARSSLRAWLYRIATNLCLDMIARRPKRIVPVDYGPASDPHGGPGEPLVESIWVEPYPDETFDPGAGRADPHARYELRESIELAFVAALQHLPPRERAVLILRDVLGYSAPETAEALGSTVTSVYSAMQRARKAVDERLPAGSQQANLRAIGDERLREIVEGYVEAWEAGDVEAIVAMLTEDAVLTMPPRPAWFRGREAIAAFLSEFAFRRGDRDVRLLATTAAGQPAFAGYVWDPAAESFEATWFKVLSLRGGQITALDGWTDPAIFSRLGLPGRLEPSRPARRT